MTLTIGIDIGTSAVKAVLLENGNRLIAASSIELPAPMIDGPHIEQDPNDWLVGTQVALKELQKSNPSEYGTVSAIGLSGQMHGAVLIGEDGFPLRHAKSCIPILQ
jgi:xylulokinase